MFIPAHTSCLYLGLGLIAVGTGMFKGNITNLLGICYDAKDPGRDAGFTMFHVSVNVGSLLASIICGYAGKVYGWHYGFGLAGIGMVLGLLVFLKYKHVLGDRGAAPVDENKTVNLGFDFLNMKLKHFIFTLCLIGSGVVGFMIYYSDAFTQVTTIIGFAVIAYLLYKTYFLNSVERKSIIFLLVLGFFFTMFLVLEMQLGALFALFTERNVDKHILGYEIPAAFSQGINPFSIILFGPAIALMFKRSGTRFSIMRYAFGLASMIACFGVLIMGCNSANANADVSFTYLFVAICIMGVGELLMVPVIDNFYTLFSPKKMRGFMMGILMLAAAFANLAGNIVAKYVSVDTAGLDLADKFASLAIYKSGFIQIMYFNILVLAAFMLVYPLLNNFVKAREKDDNLEEVVPGEEPVLVAE